MLKTRPCPLLQSLLLAALITAGSRAATADPAPTAQEYQGARKLFIEGRKELLRGHHASAVKQLMAAYRVTGDGLVMGHVALAHELAGDYRAAIAALKVYRAALPDEDRGPVDQLLVRFERRLISEGGQARTRTGSPPTDHEAGPAEQGDRPPAKPQSQPVASPAAALPAKPRAPASAQRGGRLWTWVALGGAAAFGAGALAVGLSANAEYDDLVDLCQPNCSDGQVDTVRDLALATDVLWITAAALGVAAGVLYFVEGRATEGPARAASSGKGRGAAQRWMLAPVINGHSVGVGAVLRY